MTVRITIDRNSLAETSLFEKTNTDAAARIRIAFWILFRFGKIDSTEEKK